MVSNALALGIRIWVRLFMRKHVDVAAGSTLDKLGQLNGVLRMVETDQDYRERIKRARVFAFMLFSASARNFARCGVCGVECQQCKPAGVGP